MNLAGDELELTLWQGTLSVTQGTDTDVVELAVGAATKDGESSASIVVYLRAHAGDFDLLGTHAIGETGPLGIQTVVTLTTREKEYVSERGEVQIADYNAGKVQWEVIGDFELLSGGLAVKDVRVAFEGKVEFACAVRAQATSPEEQPVGSTAMFHRVPLSDRFCQKYLD